jgi:hypothetical protein
VALLPDRAVAVVIDVRPVGGRHRADALVFVVDMTVLVPDGPPVRTRVSTPIPDRALERIHPGAEVPVQLTWHDGDLVAVLDLEADQLRPTGAP